MKDQIFFKATFFCCCCVVLDDHPRIFRFALQWLKTKPMGPEMKEAASVLLCTSVVLTASALAIDFIGRFVMHGLSAFLHL